MFTRWLRLIDEVKRARAKPGNKKPEKDKVLKNDESNTRTETNKRQKAIRAEFRHYQRNGRTRRMSRTTPEPNRGEVLTFP